MDQEEQPQAEQSANQSELETIKKERDEFLAGWQRSQADLINYQKEEGQRLKDFSGLVIEAWLQKLFPILDNFDLAEKHLTQDQLQNPSVQGLLLIKKQLTDLLKIRDIQEFSYLGQIFDPEFCEAIQEIEQDGEPGTVIEEFQKGYKINDRVLRPCKVKIVK